MLTVSCKRTVLALAVLGFAAPVFAQSPYGDAGLPVSAQPGECYARVVIAPVFKTVSDTVLKKGASERLEIIPERYDWAEETVLVKPASERMELIPAEYRWDEERVEVKSSTTRLEQVAATYRTETERQLVKPASTRWKVGRGPVEKIDNLTGEIMCLVEEPAEYKTITRQVVEQPATTRTVTLPAEYTTVRKQVVVREADVRRIQIPAEYKTVKVRKVVEAAREERIPVAAEYQTVTRQEKISDGRMEWRSVLCETNSTVDNVLDLQRALSNAGYSPGKIDGHLGAGTFNAVSQYQKANGLATGGITTETLDRLGVNVRRAQP